MTRKNISNAVGNISERHIEEAADYTVARTKRRPAWTKWGAMAACFCLCALLGIGAWQGGMFDKNLPSNTGTGSIIPLKGESITPGGAVVSDYAESTDHEKSMLTSNETENTNDFPENDTPSATTDIPVQNEVGNTGALSPFDEFWGGSYVNDDGHWVIWLTEDTPENRAEVFKRNPTISQSDTEFKEANYSLAYLTQLMSDISRAMGNNSFQFVSTASLREEKNRVVVTMTDINEDEVAKVLAFDTLGGAIEIVSGTQQNNNLEIQKGPAE